MLTVCTCATPHKGRSRCFVFDYQLEFAKFLHRQNQSVQKTPVYVCARSLLSDALSAPFRGVDDAKVRKVWEICKYSIAFFIRSRSDGLDDETTDTANNGVDPGFLVEFL